MFFYLYCHTQSFLLTQLIFKCFWEHLQVLQIKSAETGRIQNARQQVLSTVGISKATCFPWKVLVIFPRNKILTANQQMVLLLRKNYYFHISVHHLSTI